MPLILTPHGVSVKTALEPEFRHELKYLISAAQVEMLKSRLNGILSLDAHAEGGSYRIRSLYFDDYDDRCFYENENGSEKQNRMPGFADFIYIDSVS